MKKMLIPAVAVGLLACGCTSVNVYRDGDTDAQQYLNDKSENPYHIDYNVGKERVTGKGKSECWCWFFATNDGRHMSIPGITFDAGVASAKESATFEAVENVKADTLVGAMYRWTKTSKWLGFYKSVECEVIGFPAFVKGIEMIEERPVILQKDQAVIRLKTWEKVESK